MKCISVSYPKQIDNLLELDFRKIFSKVRVLTNDFMESLNQKFFKHPKFRKFSSIHVRSFMNRSKTFYRVLQKKYQQQYKLRFHLKKTIVMKVQKRPKIMTLQFVTMHKKVSTMKRPKLIKI